MNKKYLSFALLFAILLSSCDSTPTNIGVDEKTLSDTYLLNKLNGDREVLYLDSIGKQNILVIPVAFDDPEYLNLVNDNTLTCIENAFFGDSSDTSFYSLSDYYYQSSYQKLNVQGKVSDWFHVGITSSELKSKEQDSYAGEGGTIWLLNKAVDWYKENYNDIEDFDNNKDRVIDAVWLVYNVPNVRENLQMDETFWAFTFWDTNNANSTSYEPCAYSWASVYSLFGEYSDGSLLKPDTRTIIHETGHLLGLIDYYDTTGSSVPAGMVDMMDMNIGDHNAYSKFSLGWIKPRYVYGDGVYTLEPFEENGDAIIVSYNNYNETPYDEYFIIEYITPTGLNEKDYKIVYPGNNLLGYERPGIRISHVDSRGFNLFEQNDGFYVTSTDDYEEMDILLTKNNSEPTYDFLTSSSNIPFRRLTIMQKNATSIKNVLDDNFLDRPFSQSYLNNFLYFEGDSFSLSDDNYRELMPNHSSVLNNGIIFKLDISIVSLNDNEAKIAISL